MNYVGKLKKAHYQNFGLSVGGCAKNIDLDRLLLLPNQMAYLMNCQTSEIEWVGGNVKNIFGRKNINGFPDFYKYIADHHLDYVVNTTLGFWEFAKSIIDDYEPWKTVCNLDYLIIDENAKRKKLTRITFGATKLKSNIISHTIGIFTATDIPSHFRNRNWVNGPGSEFFKVPELYPFKHLLTKRELEVLAMIALGYTTRQIAQQLYVSPLTVDTHRKQMIQKLEARNTPNLVALAKDLQLI